MAEPAIKSDLAEAARLFERGVAAARGGQRRVAVGLLSRAVQYNPRHEQAWLWLSGVLDSPEEIAFCLRSVLTLNPDNERARQGLAWLEQRQMISAQTTPLAAAEPEVAAQQGWDATPTPWWQPWRRRQRVEPPQRPAPAAQEREPWWVGWRHSHREVGRVWLLVWSSLILLWALLLGLHYSLEETVARNAAFVQAEASAPVVEVPATVPGAPPALLKAQLESAHRAQVLAYLSAIDLPRSQLRQAVQTYREATQQPGSSVSHAAAARALREQLEAAHTTIAALTPPQELRQAHSTYLTGLEQERAALADLLEFYGSFSIQLSNRAILRLMEADKQLEQARSAFDQQQAVANARIAPPQTIR
ncbi:MAG TPA: hypothetical protein VFS21_02110 [Roseiflexaceae bacterium]|nr:hypothetical protein [Roseiflexaceae bacterium]